MWLLWVAAWVLVTVALMYLFSDFWFLLVAVSAVAAFVYVRAARRLAMP